jgi:pectate lyase-like protein
MKLKLIIISVAAVAISPGALAATQNITYDTITGSVTPGTQPFDFPISTKTAGLGPITVFNVKSAPYNGKGDGVTDDTGAIQAAINDATAVNGIVYLTAGTWLFTPSMTALKITGGPLLHHCIIQGAGKETTILKASAAASTEALIKFTDAPYSAIKDLTIEASAGSAATLISFANAPYSDIKDLTIDGTLATSGNYALLLTTCSYSEVSNIHVLNAYNIGIGFKSCQSLRIHDSVVEGSRNHTGILTNRSDLGAPDCSGTTISYCSVLNSFLGGIQILESGETVDHCYISGTSPGPYAGIYVARGARNCTISDNIIQYCGSVGIDVSFGTLSGYGPGDSGPDISEGIIVVGNNCSNNLGGGMSTASNGTIIANNIFKDNGNPNLAVSAGIGVVDARNVIIKGNIVGNSNGLTNQKYGILFRNAYDNPINGTVIDNDLRGNAVAPVRSDDNAGTIIPLSTGHIFSHNRGLDDGVIKKSGDYTVTSADQGATLTNTGAQQSITFTLPKAEEGLTYTFAVYPSFLVKIQATNSAFIFIGNSTSGSNGFISNGNNGSTITLKAMSPSRWYAVAREGTWAFN